MADALKILVRNGKVPWQSFKTELRGEFFTLALWHDADDFVWCSILKGQKEIVGGHPLTLYTDLLDGVQWDTDVRGLHITPKAQHPEITEVTQQLIRNGVEVIVEDDDA